MMRIIEKDLPKVVTSSVSSPERGRNGSAVDTFTPFAQVR